MEQTGVGMIGFGQQGRRSAGFTLVELVVVMVLAAVLVAVTASRWNATDATAPYQADLLARNIRHAQMLAMTWGQSLRVTVPTTTSYSVRCVTAIATPPCNGSSPVTDPATGSDFTVTLSNNVTLTGSNLDLDNLGRPVSGAVPIATTTTYTLTAGTETWSVRVSPITGYVTVGSP